MTKDLICRVVAMDSSFITSMVMPVKLPTIAMIDKVHQQTLFYHANTPFAIHHRPPPSNNTLSDHSNNISSPYQPTLPTPTHCNITNPSHSPTHHHHHHRYFALQEAAEEFTANLCNKFFLEVPHDWDDHMVRVPELHMMEL